MNEYGSRKGLLKENFKPRNLKTLYAKYKYLTTMYGLKKIKNFYSIRPSYIYGHNQTRAFNFIDDAVDGTVKAMEYGSNGEIYQIGSEEEITIDELTRYTGKIVGYSGEYINAPTYPGSVSRRCPDITKAKSELGYDPKVHWKDGLEKTINWYFTYLKADNPLYESFYDKKLA